MKYNKILTVKTQRIPIVSDTFVLDLFSPGRAIVAVRHPVQLDGIITLDLGINYSINRYFTGYIEKCVRIDQHQMRLTIRELAALLESRRPLSMRNSTVKEITDQLSSKTGIKFIIEPDADWYPKTIPYFINTGSGYNALDLIGDALDIDNYRWIPQPDGSIYIGAEPQNRILTLPEKAFTDLSISGADCALLPALRPGQKIAIGDSVPVQIEKITITNEKMRLNW